ncbi:MAG: hypothetical protein AAGF12_06415 [Myxococcota bacterium]
MPVKPWMVSLLLFGGACGDNSAEAPADAEVSPDGSDAEPSPTDAAQDATSDGADMDAGDGGQGDGGEVVATARVDTVLTYAARNREVGVRVHYPLGTSGVHYVVLVSHGGVGMNAGETRFDHIGRAIAEHRGIGVQLGHRRSDNNQVHRLDRTLDVSLAIDGLADGTIALPDFEGTADTERVGHTGHSAGAYTAHAVAGAGYPYRPTPDPRVVAIAPISPQGVGDFFEAFDNGPTDNTWVTVRVPLFTMVGGAELDITGLGNFVATDWRLEPWARYPDGFDRVQIIVPDQSHSDMGGQGGPEIMAYIGEAVATFFAAYLGGQDGICRVGTELVPEGLTPTIERAVAAGALLEGCP